MADTQTQVPSFLSYVVWNGPTTPVTELLFLQNLRSVSTLSPNAQGHRTIPLLGPLAASSKLENGKGYYFNVIEPFALDNSMVSVLFSPLVPLVIRAPAVVTPDPTTPLTDFTAEGID